MPQKRICFSCGEQIQFLYLCGNLQPPFPWVLYFWLLPAPGVNTGHMLTCKLNTHTIKIKYIFLTKNTFKTNSLKKVCFMKKYQYGSISKLTYGVSNCYGSLFFTVFSRLWLLFLFLNVNVYQPYLWFLTWKVQSKRNKEHDHSDLTY